MSGVKNGKGFSSYCLRRNGNSLFPGRLNPRGPGPCSATDSGMLGGEGRQGTSTAHAPWYCGGRGAGERLPGLWGRQGAPSVREF